MNIFWIIISGIYNSILPIVDLKGRVLRVIYVAEIKIKAVEDLNISWIIMSGTYDNILPIVDLKGRILRCRAVT